MALPTFQLRAINYGSELSSASMSRKVTTDHPLAQFMKGINSRHDAQPTESSEGPAKGDPLSDGVKALSVSDDPLGGVGDPLSGGATNVNFDGLDPLSMMMMGDPLSAPLMMPDSSAGGGVVSARDNRTASIEEAKLAAAQKFEEELTIPWQVRKQQILKDYQVSSIKVSALFHRGQHPADCQTRSLTPSLLSCPSLPLLPPHPHTHPHSPHSGDGELHARREQ